MSNENLADILENKIFIIIIIIIIIIIPTPFKNDGDIVNVSVHSSVCPPFYPSFYLQNHRAEFNQTCYMTSPHIKGVCEWVRPSFTLLATSALSVGILQWRAIYCVI